MADTLFGYRLDDPSLGVIDVYLTSSLTQFM